MGKHEVTWDAYHLFLDIGIKQTLAGGGDDGPDALTFPTPPYADETFGLGRGKSPNIAVTWHAAMEFARWISSKTGKMLPAAHRGRVGVRLPGRRHHRLRLRRHAGQAGGIRLVRGQLAARSRTWSAASSPTPFGLFDMHGNVSEWVIDRYAPDFYAAPDRRAAAGQPAGRRSLPARRARRQLEGQGARPCAAPPAGSPSRSGASRTPRPRRASGGTPRPRR